MPHLLWPFFNNNWPLLNDLFRCATRAMLKWARKQGTEVGIFCALHTYGRQLNQHIHVSVTRGCLDIKHGVWRSLFFKKKAVEIIWRSAVIRLLRGNYARIMPGLLRGLGHIPDERQWHRYLQAQYGRYWKVHFAKKTRRGVAQREVPGPVPEAPAGVGFPPTAHCGGAVVHHYLDHRTGKHKRQMLSQEEMIGRYISHVPARHFKMVRYSGFLANRKRGTLLPRVYEALQMKVREKPEKPGFAVLMKGFLGTDPYKCILCGDRLRFAGAQADTHATELLSERLRGMEKSDGCECLNWISAPEKWLSGQKHIKDGIFIHILMNNLVIKGMNRG